MRNWLLGVALMWVVFVGIPTLPAVRSLLALPLTVDDRDPRGDACYILAGSNAFRERMGAAADLYNMRRVSRVIFMRDDARGSYNFVAQANWTPTQWAVDFLVNRGVPAGSITVIERATGMFGTLQEARNLRKHLAPDLKKLVLVSSAPHMRRCLLAFRRVLPPDVAIVSCPASSFDSSYEYYYPLWVEYMKLATYFVIAR